MKLRLTTLLIFLLCNIVVGNSEDWPMFQHDPQHSGFSSSPMPESLTKVWINESHKKYGGLGLSFTISKENLFATRYMSLSALNINTGAIVKDYGGLGITSGFPAVENNVLYLNVDGRIASLRVDTGELLWYSDGIFLDSTSFPIVIDGRVIVGAGNPATDIVQSPDREALERTQKQTNRVMCLNGENGEIIWEFYALDRTIYSPAYFDGRVYINDRSTGLYCLDAQTGKLIWNERIEWTNSSPLSLDNERIFVGTYEGVACHDLNTGGVLWRYPCGRVLNTPAVAYSTVFAPGDNVLFCLDAQNGELLWKIEAESPIYSPIIVAGERVAFGTVKGMLYIVKADSGEIAESIDLGDSEDPRDNEIIALCLSEGKLVVGQGSGRITCFEESSRNGGIVLIGLVVVLLGFLTLFIMKKREYSRKDHILKVEKMLTALMRKPYSGGYA